MFDTSIHLKRYKQDSKKYHQVFVKNRCIGSFRKHGVSWVITWQGNWAKFPSKKQAVQKLIEIKLAREYS